MAEKKVRAAVLGSLLGDATSLGYMWIYDTTNIPQGDKTPLLLEAPRSKWHNPSTLPGSFTHYGAQCIALIDSLQDESTGMLRYDLDVYWSTWKALWSSLSPAHQLLYRDRATKETLNNIAINGDSPRSAGSDSQDFSVVGRVIAPLLLVFGDSDDKRTEYLAACREVASATHTSPLALAAVAFFANVLFTLVCSSEFSVSDAIKAALKNDELLPEFRGLVEKAIAAASVVEAEHDGATCCPNFMDWWRGPLLLRQPGKQNTTDMVAEFGATCPADKAIPSTVYILVRHSGSLQEALKRNIASGGDSAARGSVVACLLAASAGSLGDVECLVDELRVKYPTIARVGM